MSCHLKLTSWLNTRTKASLKRPPVGETRLENEWQRARKGSMEEEEDEDEVPSSPFCSLKEVK